MEQITLCVPVHSLAQNRETILFSLVPVGLHVILRLCFAISTSSAFGSHIRNNFKCRRNIKRVFFSLLLPCRYFSRLSISLLNAIVYQHVNMCNTQTTCWFFLFTEQKKKTVSPRTPRSQNRLQQQQTTTKWRKKIGRVNAVIFRFSLAFFSTANYFQCCFNRFSFCSFTPERVTLSLKFVETNPQTRNGKSSHQIERKIMWCEQTKVKQRKEKWREERLQMLAVWKMFRHILCWTRRLQRQ